jgi:hypothetical protein
MTTSKAKAAAEAKEAAKATEKGDAETASSLTVVLHTVGRRTVLRGTDGERVFVNGSNEVPADEVTEELLAALSADGLFSFKAPKP